MAIHVDYVLEFSKDSTAARLYMELPFNAGKRDCSKQILLPMWLLELITKDIMEFENPAFISVRVIAGMSSGCKVTWSVKF